MKIGSYYLKDGKLISRALRKYGPLDFISPNITAVLYVRAALPRGLACRADFEEVRDFLESGGEQVRPGDYTYPAADAELVPIKLSCDAPEVPCDAPTVEAFYTTTDSVLSGMAD